MISDKDLQKEVEDALAEARNDTEERRTMRSGQVKKTLWGNVVFRLSVDLPKAVPEDAFKKIMIEYGNILSEAFSAK